MIELAALAGGSFVLALSGALMPGPLLAATIAGSHRRGLWYGPGVVLGHALMEVLILAVLLSGLAVVLKSPWASVGISTVGAVAMAWMGVGLARQSLRPGPVEAEAGAMRMGAVPAGIVTTALNPYWYLWWLVAPSPLLLEALRVGWSGIASFFLGHISGDLIWYVAVALGVTRGRKWLQGRAYKALLAGCAAILFLAAGLFLCLGVQKGLATAGFIDEGTRQKGLDTGPSAAYDGPR